MWSVPFAGGVAERGAEFILPGTRWCSPPPSVSGCRWCARGRCTATGSRRVAAGHARGGRGGDRGDRVGAAAGGARTLADALGDLRAGGRRGRGDPGADRGELRVPGRGSRRVGAEEGAAAFGQFDTYTFRAATTGSRGSSRPGWAMRVQPDEPGPADRLGRGSGSAARRVARRGGRRRGDRGARRGAGRDRVRAGAAAREAAAMRGVRYGQAAKLFVRAAGRRRRRAPTLSVLERCWCYTQLGADGRAGAVRGRVRRVARRARGARGAAGPERWVAALARLRPDLDLDPSRRADLHSGPTTPGRAARTRRRRRPRRSTPRG